MEETDRRREPRLLRMLRRPSLLRWEPEDSPVDDIELEEEALDSFEDEEDDGVDVVELRVRELLLVVVDTDTIERVVAAVVIATLDAVPATGRGTVVEETVVEAVAVVVKGGNSSSRLTMVCFCCCPCPAAPFLLPLLVISLLVRMFEAELDVSSFLLRSLRLPPLLPLRSPIPVIPSFL